MAENAAWLEIKLLALLLSQSFAFKVVWASKNCSFDSNFDRKEKLVLAQMLRVGKVLGTTLKSFRESNLLREPPFCT